MRVDVADATLRIAVGHVVEQAGHRLVPGGEPADVTVTDDPNRGREADPAGPTVLVVIPVAARCLGALRAVCDDQVGAVVCADDPERVAGALLAVLGGWTVIDRRAVEIAGEAPRLGPRQAVVLELILRGHTNQQLAARLSQSVSTVKRDITELFALFGAANRLELAASALALGFGGPPSG